MGVERLYDSITKNDLEELKKIALNEHENFFKRNSHLKEAYCNSLIGICLCQGAATHYLNSSLGIKDFDIWHFYVESKSINLKCRRPKSIENGYKNRPIDFLKRAISKDIYGKHFNKPEQIIMQYLLEKNTDTKRLLLRKGIIGLYPDKIFCEVLWNGSSQYH